MAAVRDMIRGYAAAAGGLQTLEPGRELMDYPAYQRADMILRELTPLLSQRFPGARWIEEWYLYA